MFGYLGVFTGEESVMWKTEGGTDMLSIMSLFPPEGHGVVANGCGAGETTGRDGEWFLKRFAGMEVFVVHDCDKPGQDGALAPNQTGNRWRGWAPEIGRYAASVRNVVLPFEIEEKHGKDVRDWIGERLDLNIPPAEIYAELLEYARGFPTLEKLAATSIARIEDETGDAAAEDGEASAERELVEHPDDPHRLAKINLKFYESTHDGKLRYWRQQWWKYKGGWYRNIADIDIFARVTGSIKREFDSLWAEETDKYEAWLASDKYDEAKDKGPPKVRPVKKSLTSNVMEAMKSMCLLPSSVQMPCWIPDRSEPPYVSLQNGILCLDELFKPKESRDDAKVVIPHSPEWFSSLRLPYKFDPEANCPVWENFLAEVFNGDAESIEALQRWFGYLLLSDTSLQKMLFVLGRPRSGKGTISRTMTSLLGVDSVASPSLNELAVPFSLMGLVGKTLAVIGDVRLSHRADDVAITERLLAITGEDRVDILRKYLDPLLSVRLPIRFALFSNELPKLTDSSSALMSRCIFLVMPNSYIGKEDRKLGAKIHNELPGILNWAIAGRHRFQQDGMISQPEMGKNMREQMEISVSPVAYFLKDQCVLGNGEVAVRDLFELWTTWAEENDLIQNFNIQTFSRRVYDAVPNLSSKHSRDGDSRTRCFNGISVKKQIDRF